MHRSRPWFASLAASGLLVAVGVVAPRTGARADESPTLTTEQEDAFFRRWDGLGYPDVTKLRFVKAAAAQWVQWGNGPKTPIYEYGFLVSDAGPEFVLFTTDLRLRHLEKTAPGMPEAARIGFDDEDLLAFARRGVTAMRAHAGSVEFWDAEKTSDLDPFGAHRWAIPNQAWRLLIVARACAGRGARDVAHDLCSLALREQGVDPDKSPSPADRLASLEGDLAGEARYAAVESIADPHLALADLRDAFRRLAAAFPQDVETTDDAKTLARMVDEAEARAKRPSRESEDVASQIDDLVFGLREENERLWFGMPRSFEPSQGKPPSTAVQLARRGEAAIPRLLAALSDRSLTRSLLDSQTFHGQWRGSSQRYRVRDAAADLLDHFAGGLFRSGEGDVWSLHPEQEADWAAVAERANAWWKSVQENGETQILARAVAKGGRAAAAPAERLVATHPAEALTALEAGVAATDDAWAAGELVRISGGIRSDDATAWFLALLEPKHPIRVRLEAARALLGRDRRDGVAAMSEEWMHPTPRAAGPTPTLPADPAIDGDVLSFLASSGDARAYRALAKDLGARSIAHRFSVLSAFLRGSNYSVSASGPASGVGGPSPPARVDPDARRALEDLLGVSLDDDGEVDGVSMSVDGVDVDTRLGHVAARALAENLPETYRYDAKAAEPVREAQRLAAENQWRERHGLPPTVPPPPRPRPAPVASTAVASAVDRVLAAADDAQREITAASVEALGPGALPALVDRLEALAPDAPARSVLARAASRLASTITDVIVTKDSVPPDDALAKLLDEVKGKPFGKDVFTRLVLHTTNAGPSAAAGLRLRAARRDGLAGVTLAVTLVKEPAQSIGGGPGWGTSGPNLRVGEQASGGSSGTMAFDYGQKADTWREDGERVEEAFASPPRTPVVVRFSVIREE